MTFFVILTAFAAAAQDLPKIAVYVTGNVGEDEKKAFGTRMLASLINSGRYKGIERSNSFLAEIEKEQVRQRSGAIDDNQISALGKQFGVKYVCISDITPVLGAFQISARIVDVETAEVAFIGESYSALKNVVDLVTVTDQVVKNMFGGQTTQVRQSHPEPPRPEAPRPEAPKPPAPELPKPEPPQTYTLGVSAIPANGGTVSRNPNYAYYMAGTRVTLTAAPNAGYTFAGWSGASMSSASNSVTVTMLGNVALTARFQRLPEPPAPAAPLPPAHAAVSQTKTEPFKPDSERKAKNRASAGAGAFFASDGGGGLKWYNGEQVAMPYSGGGVYLYIDFAYAELFAGVSGGGGKWKSADASNANYLPDMKRSYINLGAFVKIPLDAVEGLKYFPLAGIDYEASTSAELVSNYSERYEIVPGAGDLSALWFKLGVGADVALGQSAYWRVEFLYGWRTANTYEKSAANNYNYGLNARTRPGSGVTLKTGIGFNF